MTARADTKGWTTDASGPFNVASNWTGGVPGAGDIAYFRFFGSGTPAEYTVTFPGQSIFLPPTNYVSGSLRVGPNTVDFAQSTGLFVGGSIYTLNSTIEIGEPSSIPSILNSSLFTLASPKATVGLFAGSQGTLNVNSGLLSVTGSSADYDLIVGNDGAGTMNVSGGSTVDLSGAEGNAVLGKIAGITGTVTVTGAGSTWSNDSDDQAAPLAVGGSGTGALNIVAGGQVNDFAANIAQELGSSGTATVSGVGSSWTNRGTLTVGLAGAGTLSIASGGVVSDNAAFVGSASTSSGAVTVAGAGSKWSQATDLSLGGIGTLNGVSAPASLHVTTGGQVNTGGNASFGLSGTTSVRLEDAGSAWTVGGLTKIGNSGSMIVAAGATATTNTAVVTGTVLVDETGAAWHVNDFLALTGTVCLGAGCSTPPASVSVGDGALVQTRVAEIGTQFGGSQVFVDGVGSTWSTAEQLYIGLAGAGQFFATGGAIVNSGTTEMGVSPTANGQASINSSTWSNTGDFTVGVAGAGKLTVDFGGTLTVGGLLTVGSNGTVEGNSHIVATVRNGGSVAPGIDMSPVPANDLGTLHIDGNYTQLGTGALDIELGSTASFDKLSITGRATLAGALDVSLFNGFMPTVGNSFDLLTATGGLTGTFSQVDLPLLLTGGHGPFWTVVYTSTDVILKLINSPTGDYNHNGVVDTADYVVWRESLGKTGTFLAADGDGNHVVDMADYNLWKANFGNIAGSGAGVTSVVPEPATLWLVGSGMLTACRCRRRRKSWA